MRIAYLGASVTAQEDGYRTRLHERLRSRHRQPHDEVAAGLGGIAATSIVFLADEFAFRDSPDICLVEVTTGPGDDNRSIDDAAVAMDGILAKARAAGAAPCVLHLAQPGRSERFEAVLSMFEDVAAHHSVPSIDLATPVHDAVAGGEFDPEPYFRDGVHTTPPASEAFAHAIDDALAEVAAVPGPAGAAPPAPEGNLRFARTTPVDPRDLHGGTAGRWRVGWPTFEVSEGARLTRRLEGSIDGLAVVLGPESGELLVSDSGGDQRAMAWDPWCHYERFSVVPFPRRCAPGSEVSVSLTDTVPDYSSLRAPIDPPERRGVRVIAYLEAP